MRSGTGPADDAAAAAALDAVIAEQRRRFGRVLAILVDDLPRPAPAAEDAPGAAAVPRPRSAREGDGAQATARGARRGDAQDRDRSADLRRRHARGAARCRRASPSSPSAMPVSPCCRSACRASTRRRAASGIYPQLFHELAVGDVRRPAQGGLRVHDRGRPRAAAPLSRARPQRLRRRGEERPTPSSTGSAATSISCSACRRSTPPRRSSSSAPTSGRKPPAFRYRPLTVDPSEAKKALYRIDLKAVEDPVLETLFAEKRQEIDHQLTMLDARNTPRFPFASLMLYEPVDSALRETALQILAADAAGPPAPGGTADCHARRRRRADDGRSATRRAIRRSRSISSCATTSPPA